MKYILMFISFFMLVSCAQYKVIGKFHKYDEVFIGDVNHNLLAVFFTSSKNLSLSLSLTNGTAKYLL